MKRGGGRKPSSIKRTKMLLTAARGDFWPKGEGLTWRGGKISNNEKDRHDRQSNELLAKEKLGIFQKKKKRGRGQRRSERGPAEEGGKSWKEESYGLRRLICLNT